MICQYNLTWMKEPWDHPMWRPWEGLVSELHEQARKSRGFISIHQGDPYLSPYEDPLIMGNLSGWLGPRDLRSFVWDNKLHSTTMSRTHHWFHPPKWRPHSVLYFSDILDLDEAVKKLDRIQRLGPTPEAFNWEELR